MSAKEANRAEAERVLLRRGWLARQPGEFQRAVLARGRLVRYEPGEYLHHVGDGPGGVYGAVSGGIGSYLVGYAPEPTLAHILRAGTWFGHGPLITGDPRTLSFRAIAPSMAFVVPLTALKAVAASSPEAARSVAMINELSIGVVIDRLADLLVRPGDRRIAATLLSVTGAADGVGADDAEGYRITQGELGEMANASRDLVNRTLAALEDKGCVRTTYRHISVLDAPALKRFACGQD
jgi:CRP-like cAMP-binding protein